MTNYDTTRRNAINVSNKQCNIIDNESEWIQYEGRCNIFAGLRQIEDPDSLEFCHAPKIWTFEAEEITKDKLINGLSTVGVKCKAVIFERTDNVDGTRFCKCVCYYNKPYIPYESEFFIKGLTELPCSDINNARLEVYFNV